MCLRFVFLLAAQIPAWLRLSRRPPTWKDAEILLLRHQLAVLQRQTAARPKLRWTDRALFAALLTLIPRSCHGALHLFITPGTILRWHRDIVRRRWAAKSKPKRPGRPPTHRHIVRLVLRMAADNEHWGYRRIAGELAGLGIAVAPSTVWEILKRHDIDPAPRRSGPGWAQFLRSQAEAILALDLFTVDLLDGTKAYVLAAIEHATRRIRILGATAHPGGQWIVQQARNLCMDLDQAGANVKFVLHDRDVARRIGQPGRDAGLAGTANAALRQRQPGMAHYRGNGRPLADQPGRAQTHRGHGPDRALAGALDRTQPLRQDRPMKIRRGKSGLVQPGASQARL